MASIVLSPGSNHRELRLKAMEAAEARILWRSFDANFLNIFDESRWKERFEEACLSQLYCLCSLCENAAQTG